MARAGTRNGCSTFFMGFVARKPILNALRYDKREHLMQHPDRLDLRCSLRVRRCSTGFIFCVTPHSFGFSQFFLFN